MRHERSFVPSPESGRWNARRLALVRKDTPMTQVTDPKITEVPSAVDLVTAICHVLRDSPEPLTVSKIRALLPAPFRHASPEELLETLRRQVAANVLQS